LPTFLAATTQFPIVSAPPLANLDALREQLKLIGLYATGLICELECMSMLSNFVFYG